MRPADHEFGVLSHQFPSPWDSPLIRIFLFCAYLGLATVKHAKSKLSLVKFFSIFSCNFPDADSVDDEDREFGDRVIDSTRQ